MELGYHFSSLTLVNMSRTEYAYDVMGRMLQEAQVYKDEAGVWKTVVSSAYSYDNNGNVTTTKYNARNLPVFRIEPGGISGQTMDMTKTMGYTYNADGSVFTQTDQNGVVTTLIYDIHGRVLSQTAGNLSVAYTYDNNGNILTQTDETGITTRTYDSLNRTTSKNIQGVGLTTYLSTFNYAYDGNGNMVSKLELGGLTSYAYDALGRLSSVTEPDGRITGYGFDAAGNRLTETVTCDNSVTITVYTYNAQNRLVSTREISGHGDEKITDYFYDNNGSQVSMLVSVISGQSGSTGYSLDRIDAGTGNQTAHNVYGGSSIISRATAQGTDYYLYNGRGDVVQLTTTWGAVTVTYDYDPFGNLREAFLGDFNPFRYFGEYWDFETKRYNLRARYYDPGTGRFTQRDAFLGFYNDPLSLNRYTYCHNNPIRYVDPSGYVVSEADKKYLTNVQQAAIQIATDKWIKANAAGDQAGMDAAHATAEAIRNSAGYSGGSDGAQYTPLPDKKPADSGSSSITYNSSTISNSVVSSTATKSTATPAIAQLAEKVPSVSSDSGGKAANGTIQASTTIHMKLRLDEATKLMNSIYPGFFDTIAAEWGFDLRVLYEYALNSYNEATAAASREAGGKWSQATAIKFAEADRAVLEVLEFLRMATDDIRSLQVYAKVAAGSDNLTNAQQTANAEYICSYLLNKGWELEAICGLLGNILHESHFNPGVWFTLNEPLSAYGIVQFRPATDFFRHYGFNNSTEAVRHFNNMALSDPQKLMDMQLEFMIYSCQPTTPSNQRRWQPDMAVSTYHAPYKMTFSEYISSTKSAGELAVIFASHFERSGASLSQMQSNRGGPANDWFTYFSNR